MRTMLAVLLGALWLMPAAAAAQTGGGKDVGTKESLLIKLDKEPELADQVKVMFTKDPKHADQLKGYQHGAIEEYDKVAIREKILDGEWEAKCRTKPECANVIDEKKAQGALQKKERDPKRMISRIAKKLAFLRSLRRKLKAESAKGNDAAADKKIVEANRLVEADIKKAISEAKAKNEAMKLKVFDTDAMGEPAPEAKKP